MRRGVSLLVEPSPRTRSTLISLYALGLFLAGGLLVWWTGTDAPAEPRFEFPWIAIAIGFFLVEAIALHIEIRRESHTLSLSGLPLILGLMSMSPLGLLGARLVGTVLAMTVIRRRGGLKLVWNISLLVAETALALLVARIVVADGPPAGGGDWLVLLAALIAADLLGLVAVPLVSMVAGAERPPTLWIQMLRTQAIAFIGATFAVVVAAAMTDSAALVLIGVLPIVGVALLLRAYGRLNQEHTDLQRIHGFTAATGRRDSLDVGLRELTSILRSRGAALAVATPDGRYAVRAHVDDEFIDLTVPAPADTDGRPGIIDLTDPAEAGSARVLLDELGGSGGLGVRLHDVAEEPAFVLVFDRLGMSDTFGLEEARLFESIASTLGTRLSADRLLERLELQAMLDDLTGLANRVTLEHELDSRIVDPARRGGVLLLDLDRFKDVNDSLGHQFGDELLRAFASRLTRAARTGDLVARLGGDEFAVVFDAADGDVDGAVDRLARLLGEPIELEGLTLELGVSIGLTDWPTAGHNSVELLREADIAMYEAKRTHQPWIRYSPQIDHASSDRLALLGQLRDAIQRNQLCIHLQPQVRVHDLGLVGAEALVRWNHPELGLVMPGDFVPLAEHSNLAGELTRCMIAAAADAAVSLRDLGFELPISVNLTSRDLLDRTLAEVVERETRRRELPPSAISFEITESSLIVDIDAASTNLAALRALGSRTSVDDFGTGYASLRYLQLLPLDEVKIDRSFISQAAINQSDGAIVASTARLIRDLGLDVVAEGVEDDATLGFLREVGVDTMQGYLVSRPLPVAEFIEFALLARMQTS
jgi:diguanylate cyclase (GGDEF)-like protein